MGPTTLSELTRDRAQEDSGRAALLGSDGLATTRADLVDVSTWWAGRIEQLGLGGDDRIAVSLPNGVRMATSFLGIAAHAVCAPLNPKYTDAEAEFFLTDLQAGLVVVAGDASPGVRSAAERLGISILDLDLDVDMSASDRPTTTGAARGPSDIAMILHTSGTTSRPKQVPLTHANLLASARSVQSTLGLEPSDRCANVMPLFHIHGLVGCLLASLHAGSSVVCTNGFDPHTFLETVARLRCTWYSAVPTIHQAVLGAAAAHPDDASQGALRFIRSSSASLPPSVMERLEQQFSVPVLEAYGMTEAAHQMASNQLPPGTRRAGAVGIASGPEISVVDAAGNHLDTGAVGELVIRGESVMRGYLSPPEANDGAFFDDWFRTGDQGTIDRDGVVTLTGRLKELINRAGEKIAPREIDEALLADAEISEALAFALPHPTLGEDVGAVVIPVDPDTFDPAGVLGRLRTRLSEHKIPRRLVVVDELPKGATGKPARIGLAERLGLDAASTDRVSANTAPADPLVGAVCAVWCSVLGVSVIDPDDDFVTIGGDSLSALATSLVIEDVFGVSIPAGMLMGPAASPHKLAIAIREERESDIAADTAFDARSSAAQRLWTMQQIDPSSAAYNVGFAIRVQGLGGGAETVEDAIGRLVDRHPALRMRIGMDDGAVSASPTAASPVIVRRDLSAAGIADFVTEIMDRPIDLGVTPVHAGIGHLDDHDIVVVVATHHALVDGPSTQVMRRDLGDLLAGRELPPAGEPTVRSVRRRKASTEFWRAELGELPPAPDLPLPAVSSGPGAERSTTTIAGPGLDDLRRLARTRGATLFSVLLAAHAEVLRRIGAQDDVIIAIPVTSRPPGDDTTVGMYIETVPVRIRLGDAASVDDLLSETHRTLTGALVHGDVPFDELVELASLRRSAHARPLAGTMCQLRPPATSDDGSAELSIEVLDASSSEARFDLAVDFTDRDDSLEIVVEHDRMAIDDVQGRRHAERVARVLDGFTTVEALAEIDIRSADERSAIVPVVPGGCGDPAGDFDLVAALDAMAASAPDSPSIIEGDQTTTRGELNARSHAFAARFDEAGACESRPVGIALPRGADAVAAMIGAWRVGAPYVTFDSSVPTERDRTVVERTAAAIVVAETDGWNVPTIDPADLIDRQEKWPTSRPAPIAWILSTSGSAGEPKLVPGPMAGLINRLQWGQRVIPITGPSAHRAPLMFVDHAAEIFEPLLGGQPLVVIDDDTVRDPRRLADVVEAAGVTRLLVVPTLMRMLLVGLRDGNQLASLDTVVSSGEPLPRDVADDWHRMLPDARLVNVYGSTEVGADAAAGDVTPGGVVTVGSPIDGFRIEVVSSSGPPSPPGCVGEIWISGVGVMSGYLQGGSDDALVSRDVDGEVRTWYRTGDRGRFDPDGRLIVVGRVDSQLKVRGVRIDPLEIEAVLRSTTGAKDVAVYVHDDVLAAVLVGPPVDRFDAQAPQLALAESLPPTHIPSQIRVVEELPRTATGKLDRSALVAGSPVSVPTALPLDSPTERWLGEQIRTLIPDVHEVSIDDDFFSIGGQSLTAVELFVRIEREFRVDLPVSLIFDAPTVGLLAVAIDTALADPSALPRKGVSELSRGSSGFPTVVWCTPGDPVVLRELRDRLGNDIRLVALETPGRHRGELPLRRVEQIAAHHARTMASLSVSGPVVIGGNSFGGLVALELARLLEAEGTDPVLLVIVDTWPPGARPDPGPGPSLSTQLVRRTRGAVARVRRMARKPGCLRWSSILDERRANHWRAAKRAAAEAFTAVEPLDTTALLFTSTQRREKSDRRDLGWDQIIHGRLDVIDLEGSHGGLLTGALAAVVGSELAARLEEHFPAMGQDGNRSR